MDTDSLSGITPPDIRQESRMMSLIAAAVENQNHLLYHCVSSALISNTQRPKSHRPFFRHAADLFCSNLDPVKMCGDRVNDGLLFARSACPKPSLSLPPGADSPRK